MDPSKLETISKWPIPTKKKEVQLLLGFVNYYNQFSVNYSAKVYAVIDLTKDVLFTWAYIQQQAFDELQVRFLLASILIQFGRTLKSIMETNASNQTIAGILSQNHIVNGCKQLHPIEYNTKTHSATQHN